MRLRFYNQFCFAGWNMAPVMQHYQVHLPNGYIISSKLKIGKATFLSFLHCITLHNCNISFITGNNV